MYHIKKKLKTQSFLLLFSPKEGKKKYGKHSICTFLGNFKPNNISSFMCKYIHFLEQPIFILYFFVG